MIRLSVSRCVAIVLAGLVGIGCTSPVTVLPTPGTAAATASGTPGTSVAGLPTSTPAPTPSPAPTIGLTPDPGAAGTPGATGTTPPTPSAPPTPIATPTPSLLPTPIPFPVAIGPDLAAAVQAEVDLLRRQMSVPGLSVAVRLSSGETWTAVSGVGSLDPEERVTPKTVFAIASITKTFVAALILRLEEDGALSIDDPLSNYLPEYPRARRITLRQLLSHTSGLHDYLDNGGYLAEAFSDLTHVWTLDEILELVLHPICRPGTCYHYSNTNFVLLGRVAEVVTGLPVARLIRTRFLEPLGLGRTAFQPDDPTPQDAAHGFILERGTMVDLTVDSEVIPNIAPATVTWAAGSMASTPTDLTTWAAALYGGDVLQSASLTRMIDFSGPYSAYGLGTRSFLFRGRPAMGHTGSIHGFVAVAAYFPADDVAIAICANRGNAAPERVLKRLVAVLLGLRSAPS